MDDLERGPAAEPALPTTAALERWAVPAVLLYTLLVIGISLRFHATPLYQVETDLLGEYVPAARSLAAGVLSPAHYAYKGPGYPLLLAGAARLCGGDYYLAARWLSAVAIGLAAWIGFLLVRAFAGPRVALFALGGLLANPTLLRYGIEAGTDAPTMAVALAATYAVMRSRSAAAATAAGLAAGCAIVMRYNMAFLVPAAALVLLGRPGRLRALAGYAAGLLLPLGAWLAINGRLSGHPLANSNYLNVAYELYGRGLPWDRFEAQIGSRFHSLAQVLSFDPARAAGRLAWNLGAHFVSDLHRLLPWWLGLLAGPGLLLAARLRAWRPAVIHFALCAAVLAGVFYAPRFSIYLLPFYLAGAGALLLEPRAVLGERLAPAAVRDPAPALRRWTAGLALLALALSAVGAGLGLRADLAQAPVETRIAGRILAERGLGGERIVARKPHVAYFAGMQYVPMTLGASLPDLMARARAAGARYLFYSPIEQILRPEYAVLGDSGLSLPGLDQVLFGAPQRDHFYAVYRVAEAAPDSAALAAAIERARVRYADRHRDRPEAQVFLALGLVEAGRYHEALDRLLPLERAGARDPAVAKLASTAYLGIGDYERSYRECELAMSLEPPTAWHYARIGAVRAAEKRYREARDAYRRAVDLEPGNPENLEQLGLACVALKEFGPAAAAFERCLALAPRSVRLRRYAMGAYQLAGDSRRARAIMEAGVAAGIPLQQMLDPDSAR